MKKHLLFIIFYLSFAVPAYGQQTDTEYCGALGTWTYQVAWKRALGVPQDEVIKLIGHDESVLQGTKTPLLPVELPGIINFVYELEEYEPTAANVSYIALAFRRMCIEEITAQQEKQK